MIKNITPLLLIMAFSPISSLAQTYYEPSIYTSNTGGYLNGTVGPINAIRNTQNANGTQNNTTQQNPDANLVPGWSVLESKTTNTTQNKQTQKSTNNVSRPQETQAEQIARMSEELEGNPTKKKTKKTDTNSNIVAPQILNIVVTGKPLVLDAITLSLQGHIFSLNNVKAPGNGQICYRNGSPWSCGDDAKKSMENLLNDKIISCHIVGKKGICLSNTGEDIIKSAIETGYVLPTPEDGTLHKKQVEEARLYERGLYQK